jgi:hypothetical protein
MTSIAIDLVIAAVAGTAGASLVAFSTRSAIQACASNHEPTPRTVSSASPSLAIKTPVASSDMICGGNPPAHYGELCNIVVKNPGTILCDDTCSTTGL